MKTLTAHELRRMILDDEEIALLDAREEGAFHDSHLFDAPVRVLEGGNAAWVATGYSLTTTESRFLDDDIDDVLVRIHEAEGAWRRR